MTATDMKPPELVLETKGPKASAVFTAPTEAHAIAPMRLGSAQLTPEQVELIKKTVAKGATDDELELFAHVCNRTGLDPFARQIYAIKRRQKNEANEWVENMVFQVSIDGFRLIAERSGKYRGQTPPVFYDKAGNEREVWLDPKTPPSACKIGAHRAGAVEPLWGIAVFDEFKQTKYGGELTKMWKEKPSVMIAKCAEATALRKAFPQELSGLYIHEEMEPTEEEPTEARDRQVSKSKPHVTPGNAAASADADGDVVLTWGTLKGRKLSSLTREEITKHFLEPWKDESREATAALRLGAGFVKAVRAAFERAPIDTKAKAREAYDLLAVRKASGATLSDEEAEDMRNYELDHPEEFKAAPQGDGLTRAGEQVGIPGL